MCLQCQYHFLRQFINNLIASQQLQAMQVPNETKKTALNFNFGMKAFEAAIEGNFISIQDTLNSQQAEITRLANLLLAIQNKQNSTNNQPSVPESKEGLRIAETVISSTQDQNANQQNQSEQALKKSIIIQKQKEQKDIVNEKLFKIQAETRPSMSQHSPLPPPPSIENQTSLQYSSEGVKVNSNGIFEEKVFQLFERVRQLEQKASNSERFSLKKFREFQFQAQEAVHLAEKSVKSQSHFDQAIDKLRNQISEYKLKKQSKIMKALNSSSLNQTSTGQNYDYITEKLQFLLKHVSELLTKKAFEEERETLHQGIDNLRKKMNQSINQTYFQETLKSLQTRIYQSVSKYVKALQFSGQALPEKGGAGEKSVLDSIIEDGNREISKKVNEHEQKIKLLSEELAILKSEVESSKKERIQFEDECSEQVRLTQDKCEATDLQMEGFSKYLQELKQMFNQKHLQSESQIIELQDAVEKVSSSLKSLTFTAKDMIRSSNTPIYDNPEYQLSLEKASSNVELENDLKSQMKKFNKLHSKVQGLKEDILGYRQDLMRQIEAVKANIERKADWDSLKKGLNYFEEKMRETKAITQAIYESTGKEEGDSLAVKKGWTCLVCDKDIKNYEGKLGELKFTSMFPVRESPRIGGYYKQQQATQQYRQVFLSNSNLNNRSRRIGSLKSNQSKEEQH